MFCATNVLAVDVLRALHKDPDTGQAFLARLRGIGAAVPGDALVPVILDGENCWEHYPGGGVRFLRALGEWYRKSGRALPLMDGFSFHPYPNEATDPLERGFHRGPLSWLSPSLGSVESLQPINAAPPDLRDEMCGPHRKRPAARHDLSHRPVGLHRREGQRARQVVEIGRAHV